MAVNSFRFRGTYKNKDVNGIDIVYSPGDVVVRNDKSYIATTTITGYVPETLDRGGWSLFGNQGVCGANSDISIGTGIKFVASTGPAPYPLLYKYGDRWFSEDEGLEYVLIQDEDCSQWVQIYSGIPLIDGITGGTIIGSGFTATSGSIPNVNNFSYGDRWFDEDDGIEYVLIIDSNSRQWVQVNGGPKGNTGDQGQQGATGATGSNGATGATGPGITLGVDLNTGVNKNAYNTLGTDAGRARKLLFLNDDGTFEFDYLLNYDIFKPSDFRFSIQSFDVRPDGGNSSTAWSNKDFLIGASPNTFSFQPYGVTAISYVGTVFNCLTNVYTNSNGTSIYSSTTGFPVILSDPFIGVDLGSGQTMAYPNFPTVKTLYLGISASGINSDGITRTDRSTKSMEFKNYRYLGATSYDGIQGSPAGLSYSPNEIINIQYYYDGGTASLTSNSLIDFTFGLTANSGQYVVFSYPERLGAATQIIDPSFPAANLLGSFLRQSGLTISNTLNFAEKYYVYRSLTPSLGVVNYKVIV